MKRLRASVDIWKDASGVQIVAQDRTINFKGNNAALLWDAVEPALRTGFVAEGLVAALPIGARKTVESLLADLDALSFLAEAEEPLAVDGLLGADVFRIVDGITEKPLAASRLLAKTTVRLGGPDADLRRNIEESLIAAGIDVGPQRGSLAGASITTTGARVTVTVQTPGRQDGHLLVCDDGSLVKVGPVPAVTGDLATAAAVETNTPVPGLESFASDPVAAALVSGQVVIALAHNAALLAEANEKPPLVRKWWVTDRSITAEIHRQVDVENLHGLSSWPIVAVEDFPADGTGLIEALPDELSVVWDEVFGAVKEPHPRDLPQVPVSLAVCSDAHGRVQGGTASELPNARWDALEPLLRQTLKLPTGKAIGPTPMVSATAAVVDELLNGNYEWLPDGGLGDWGSNPRRALARLHRWGVPEVDESVLRWGPVAAHRVTVTLDGMRSTAVASGKDSAREIAIARAEGMRQWCTMHEKTSAPAERSAGIADRDLVASAIENGMVLRAKAVEEVGLIITEVVA
ncbi:MULTISPECIES: hypothetical protein [Arthrobacter]|uniref:Uncharacterized protein n=1 Tax=Arthrobacter terricola TaxID=2547396 RepID=A0A4R5KB83_9MICC|nr:MULTISPECIES: hypothetical protein [Arthrobacter]MBT8163030.1 hypothetical protein [Arthrobacter sp. GN70]TDF91765.1 hypothetical protein E1809_19800 [Arthrobacter terricola]